MKAIEDQMAVLPDRSSARQDRRRVLKFLLHLVGDIHQPLHAGRFEDRGGGLIRVKYFGKQLTLHKLWDSTFIDRTGLTEAELTKKAIQASSASSFGGTPAGWANESHRLAISHAYQLEDGGEINGKYEQDSLMVIYRRLGQAGTRLAHLLNKAFRSKTSSSGF